MSENRERQRRREAQRRAAFQPRNTSSGTHESDGAPPPGGSGPGGTGSGGAGKGGGWMRPAIAVAVAMAIGIGAFVGLSGGGGSDSISDADSQSRIAAHQALLAGPGLPVVLVGSEDVDEAIASMPETVPEETRQEMRQQIDLGRLQLAWVTLWDTHAEDGDVLRFESSASIPIEVMALNAKTKFAIPYPVDGEVLVTGVRDGGGGITIALESGATQIAWPTMAPGDTLRLPVTPSF